MASGVGPGCVRRRTGCPGGSACVWARRGNVVRVGHALQQLPSIAAAFGDGRLSYCKVRALTRVATPTTEAELLDRAADTTGSQCVRFVRAWRTALTTGCPASSRWTSFRRRTEADGSVVYTIRVAADDVPCRRRCHRAGTA